MKPRQFGSGCPKRPLRGFTLIEMMIVVAVLGILATIAYPSYHEFILKGRRADGKISLQRGAQWMEKAATISGAYPKSDAFNKAGLNKSEEGRYTIEVSNRTVSTFTLKATPTFADEKCTLLSLDHTGVKGKGGTGTVDECWGR